MTDFSNAAVMNLAATTSPLSAKTTQITEGPCRLFGVYVNTVFSGHTAAIRDYSLAQSPLPTAVTLVTLPASLAAGTNLSFPGIEFKNGLNVLAGNVAMTGSITLLVKPGTASSLLRY